MGVGDTPVKDISSVAVTHLDPGAHVDGYGEHGHFGKDSVVHTPDGRFVPIDSPFGQTKQKTGKGFPIGVPAKLIGSHQDHHTRTTVKHIGTHIEHKPKLPGVTRLDRGDHIDFHGEDDNLSGKPVLHKADGRRLPLDSAVGSAIPQTGAGHQIDASATHLGIPRKHVQKPQGLPNIDPDPHIDAHVTHAGTLIGVPHLDSAPTLPGVTRLDRGDHIDFHGVHGNLSGKPVLHKADGRRVPMDSAVRQIDLHAAGHVSKLPTVTKQDPGDHIDPHGKHGNFGKDPVLHTAGGKRFVVDPLFGDIDPHAVPVKKPAVSFKKHPVSRLPPGSHIDPPGVHGNTHNVPVIHTPDGKHVHLGRDRGHTIDKSVTGGDTNFIGVSHLGDIDPHAVPVKKLPGVSRLPPGSHIDPPEVHGNTHNVPVIHTPDGKHVHLGHARGHTIDKSVTEGAPNVIGVSHLGVLDPHAVPMKKLPGVSRLPPGSHIDPPEVHGNTHNVPVIHMPDGKHVHLGRARGHTIDKSVTGGAPNVIGVSHLGDIYPHAVPVKKLPGVPRLPPGSHNDPPEVHGNTHNVPVIHTPDGKHVHLGHARGHTIDKSVTRVGPNLIGVSRLGDKDSHSVLMNKLPEVSQLPPGSHIDPPKLHGNTHNVPVIHTPDGKHVHLRCARGHTIDKSVTGVNLKRMPDTVIDIQQTVVVTKEVPDLPPHTHIKPDLLPVDRPLAHIKPEFPEVDGPFKLIKPDIPSVDTIPDLFSTESAVHPTEHMSHREIVPELSAPIEKHNSKQALNKQIRKQLQSAGQIANRWQNLRLQQQRRQKLERYGSRSRRKFRKPSRRPLKPARRIRPQKNLGGIVKNIFQRMYGRGGGRGRGRVRPARFRQGRRRRGQRGRQRRFRRDHE